MVPHTVCLLLCALSLTACDGRKEPAPQAGAFVPGSRLPSAPAAPPQKDGPKIGTAPLPELDATRPAVSPVRVLGAKAPPQNADIAVGFKPYPSDEYRESYLENAVLTALAGLAVEVSKTRSHPTDLTRGFCVRSHYGVQVYGPWADVSQYAARLQKPEEWRFVSQLAMVSKPAASGALEPVVTAQIEIEKWWPAPPEEGTASTADALTDAQRKYLQTVARVAHTPPGLLHSAMALVSAPDSQVRVTGFFGVRVVAESGEKATLSIAAETSAADTQPATVFITALKATQGLAGFQWETGPPAASGDSRTAFKLTGTLTIDGDAKSP